MCPRPANPDAHEALLEAARIEFARRGLDRSRVEDVARRARVSKGAFYLHFRTKEDAFLEILQRFLGAFEDLSGRREDAEARFAREEAARAPAGDGAGSLERMVAFECEIDAQLLDLLWRNRHIVAAADAAGPRFARVVADFRRGLRGVIVRRIAARQAAGQLRPDLPATVVGDVVFGSYEGFARRMVDMKEKPDVGAWARSFLRLVYEGLLPRSAPGGQPARPPRDVADPPVRDRRRRIR